VAKPFRIPDLLPKILELMEKYPAPSAKQQHFGGVK
jgi:hypothetical protein